MKTEKIKLSDIKEREDEINFSIKTIKEINYFRKLLGLSLIKESKIKCLICNKKFKSINKKTNKICNKCKKNNKSVLYNPTSISLN